MADPRNGGPSPPLQGGAQRRRTIQSCPWVGSTHGLGWVGLGRVGLMGRGSETFPQIIKLHGRPLVTVKVIPDNLIMINDDILSLTVIVIF